MRSAASTPQLYVKLTGRPLDIDESHEFARGGEGAVYRIPWDSSSLAKYYFEPKSTRSKKLHTMLANPPDDPMKRHNPPSISIAWPRDLVVDGAGHVRGFVMPFIEDIKPIYAAYHPSARLKVFPGFDYRFPYFAGANLATAFQALHEKGYVIGDVNENNIQVNHRALVTVIDTDSFQVPNERGGYHRCGVCVPNYTPHEMQNQDLTSIDRRPEQDCFGLAVLLFQLLMEGNHPYDGVYTGPGESPTIAERITRGYFPHGVPRVPLQPRSLAPDFGTLPPRLQELFRLCFADGHDNPSRRPSAETWKVALWEASRVLITCPAQPRHSFSPHLTFCPWCEYDSRIYHRKPKSVAALKNAQAGIQHALPAVQSARVPKPPVVVASAAAQSVPQHSPAAATPSISHACPPPIQGAQSIPAAVLQPAIAPPIAAGTPGAIFSCSSCGGSNLAGVNFCTHCGHSFISTPLTTPAASISGIPIPPPLLAHRTTGLPRVLKWAALLVCMPIVLLICLALIGVYFQENSSARTKTQATTPISTTPATALTEPTPLATPPAVATTTPVTVATTPDTDGAADLSAPVATGEATPITPGMANAAQPPTGTPRSSAPANYPQAWQETDTDSGPHPSLSTEPEAPAVSSVSSIAYPQNPRIQAPRTIQLTPTAPQSFPSVARREPAYNGPLSGTATWRGKLGRNDTLTITDGSPSTGVLSGAGLPGVPVRLTIDESDLGFAEIPNSSNGYRRLVLRSHSKHEKITIHWNVTQYAK